MNNKVLIAFETVLRSKEIVKKIEPSFYPAGNCWLLAFSRGNICLHLWKGDTVNMIENATAELPDFILVKDAELSKEELDMLDWLTGKKDIYIIHHFNKDTDVIRKKNDASIRSHAGLGYKYGFAITQSHLDGDFFYDELVKILGCVEQKTENGAAYEKIISGIFEKRFPDPVLEAKLDILHKCQVLEDANTAQLPDLLIEKYGGDFKDFQKELTDQNLDSKLKVLRDILLPR